MVKNTAASDKYTVAGKMRRVVLLVLLVSLPSPLLLSQQPQAQSGQPLYPVNAKYVQGFGPGYWPTAGSNLTLNLAAGTAVCGNVVRTYAGGTLSLAASTTNYVYLDASNNCTPASNTTGFTTANIPIATVVTNSTAIVSVTDVRTLFVSSGITTPGTVTSVGMAGDGIIFNPAVSGSPVASSGTLTPQLLTQTPKTVLAGPASGGAATPTFRALTAADLPATISSNTTGAAATAAALSSTPTQCAGSQFTLGIAANGNANCAQPAFSNLSGSLGLGQTPLTTAGDLLFANSTPALARLPVGGSNQFLGISGGLPAWTQPAFNNLSGTATIAQGGTGQTTANAAFNALSPLTTEGDLLYYHSSTNARLGVGASGKCLTSNGTDPVWGACSTGSGTVTSVGLSMPSMFSVSGTPVTSSGTLSATLANQSAHLFLAGPSSGSAAAPTFRALVGSDLPTPAASTLGGVESISCTSGQFLNQISTAGVPSCAATTGSSADLGNGTSVIDASLEAGTDFASKVNAAVALLPSGGIVDARGLSGAQTMSANIQFSSANGPVTILLAEGLSLTRASGVQFIEGAGGLLKGTGASNILGNDSTAAVRALAGINNPRGVEGVTIENSGNGGCIDYISQGVVNTVIKDNHFYCATGILLTGYWNTIVNNTFSGSTASPSVSWAGIMLDSAPGAAPNDNWIERNTYGLAGTGLFWQNGYTLSVDDRTCEGSGLCYWIGGTGGDIKMPYNEGVQPGGTWAADTQYGRGALLAPGNGWYYICTADGTTGSSAPTWPTAEGGTVADGTVTWKMFSGIDEYTHHNGSVSGMVSVVLAGGRNRLTGAGAQQPSINDEQQSSGTLTNYIQTVGNIGWGTPGFDPWMLSVDYKKGLEFIQSGAGKANINFAQAEWLGAPYGIELDSDSLCATSGSCGHFPLRVGGLNSVNGVNVLGPAGFSPLPTPGAPTLSNSGASGSTSYTYYIVAHTTNLAGVTGTTLPSAAATITNAPATLGGGDCVDIQVPTYIATSGVFEYDPWSMVAWDILKGDTSHSLATAAWLPNGMYQDCGGTTSAYTAPTRNTTADAAFAGKITSGNGVNALDDGSGNVGIGTTSPSYRLHVQGSAGTSASLIGITNTNASGVAGFSVINSSGDYFQTSMTGSSWTPSRAAVLGTVGSSISEMLFSTNDETGTGGSTPIKFQAGGWNVTPQMTILPAGYVGIGTTSPAYTLDLEENQTWTTPPLLFMRNNNSGGQTSLDFMNDNNNQFRMTLNGSGFGNNAGFETWGSSIPSMVFCTNCDISSGGPTVVQFRLGGWNVTPQVTFSSTGVGIGTTSPGQKLDVAGGYIRSDTGFCISTNCLTAWSPMTTLGDMTYGGASGASTRLAGNTTTTKEFLTSTGSGSAAAAPAWGTIATSDLPLHLGAMINVYCYGTMSATAGTYYFGGWGGVQAACGSLTTTLTGGMPEGVGGTIKKLRCNAGTAGLAAGSGVVQIYDGGTSKGFSCTIGTGTSCADSSTSFAFSAGDLIQLSVASGGSSESLADVSCSAEVWVSGN